MLGVYEFLKSQILGERDRERESKLGQVPFHGQQKAHLPLESKLALFFPTAAADA